MSDIKHIAATIAARYFQQEVIKLDHEKHLFKRTPSRPDRGQLDVVSTATNPYLRGNSVKPQEWYKKLRGEGDPAKWGSVQTASNLRHKAKIKYDNQDRLTTIAFDDFAIELSMRPADLEDLASKKKVLSPVYLYFGPYGFSSSRTATLEIRSDSLYVTWRKGSDEDGVEISRTGHGDIRAILAGKSLQKTLWLLLGDNLELLYSEESF